MSDVMERAMFILHTNKLAEQFFADEEDHNDSTREEAYEDVERTAYLGDFPDD